MSTYDVDRFESRPDPDLICCICHCVLDKPLESPCQHVFCKVCIETWLKNHHSCPSCRKRLKESKLKPALPIIKNMISRLIMKCENADQGCKAKVQLEHYTMHIDSCDFVQINCMNTGCTKVVVRKDMYCHEKECSFRLVPCKRGCGLPVAAKDANGHKCVEELKERLQKLEDSFENYKRDSEMRLVQLENMVADLQNRAQQDSSASDVDQEDDNSRDSPDEDANDPDSDDVDEDDYQSDGGGGGDSGEDDDDNGSNNDDEYDQDSDGGNSGQSYESSSSIEYASDASSYRDYHEYDREENSDDVDSNDSVSVEELNSTPPPPTAHPTPPPQATSSRNLPVSRDLAAFIFNPTRGTITPYVANAPRSTPSTPSQHVNTHTALNTVTTPLPPPPPYRPTSSSVPSLNMVSVSADPANTGTRCGMVGLVSTSPAVSVVPTSRPEIKMQLSFQVISRSQASSTVTSTVTRPSGERPLIPSVVQVSAPIWNNSPSTSNAQGGANRSTLSFATVTSTQTTSLVTRSGRSNDRPSTNTAQPTPIPLRHGTSRAEARAALRPLAMGSGSVIASRIPGTRRRRSVPSHSLTSHLLHRRHLNTPAATSTHRSQPLAQRAPASATAAVAASPSSSSSSLNLSSSHQVPVASQSSRSSQPTGAVGGRPSTSRSASDSVQVVTPGRSAVPPAVTVSMTRCRNLMVTTGSSAGTRTVRSSGEPGTTTNRLSGSSAERSSTQSSTSSSHPVSPSKWRFSCQWNAGLRALKRSHNDDSSSSDESDTTSPPQRAKRVCLPSRKYNEDLTYKEE